MKENVLATEKVHKCTVQIGKGVFQKKIVLTRMVFGKVIKKKRSAWCLRKRHLSVYQYRQKVIFSDEGQVVIGNNHRIYVWRKANESYLPQCMCPHRKSQVSVMVRG